MNPTQLLSRAGGLTILAVAGGYLLLRKFVPQLSDCTTAAIHFRNSIRELQKGVEVIVFGAGNSEEDMKKVREARRIIID